MRLNANTDAMIDYRFHQYQRQEEFATDAENFFQTWCSDNDVSEDEKELLRREFENDPDGFIKEDRWGI